jgi:hypothetical protein
MVEWGPASRAKSAGEICLESILPSGMRGSSVNKAGEYQTFEASCRLHPGDNLIVSATDPCIRVSTKDDYLEEADRLILSAEQAKWLLKMLPFAIEAAEVNDVIDGYLVAEEVHE